MSTLSFEQTEIKNIITHRIGNPAHEEVLELSESSSSIMQHNHQPQVLNYFTSSFKPYPLKQFDPENFTDEHSVAHLVAALFEQGDQFIPISEKLAKKLYQISDHPMIKPGEFNLVLFSGVQFEEQLVDAVGIFKSEVKIPFIKMEATQQNNYLLHDDEGYAVGSLDKGCIVLKLNKAEGYKVFSIDQSSSSTTKFWDEEFLGLQNGKDDFHFTKDMMQMTKSFVTDQLVDEYQKGKPEQMEMLNNAMDYFKSNEHFSKQEFAEHVFEEEDVIQSFKNFGQHYKRTQGAEIEEHFDISTPAVKSYSKVFKSILKLDKNFHIYIHGDRSKITRHVDEDGRKYYKIYFEQEL